MKSISLLLFTLLICSCASQKSQDKKIELSFLDEYVIPVGEKFEGTSIGGLSGIDYKNGLYYLVVDDAKNPRFYTAKIEIDNNKILGISFLEVVSYTNDPFYKNNWLDLESIIVEKDSENIVVVSEGRIKKNKDPLLFITTEKGEFIKNIPIPDRFSATSEAQPIHNKALESLSLSSDNNGYWTAMELPLKIDGDQPKYQEADSPVRITYFDKTKGKATKEFAYKLSPITKPFKGSFNLNGITDILEFSPNHFFVIERAYQNEYGPHGNTVKIFHAYSEENTTNTIDINSLRDTKYIPLKKELLLNFDDIKSKCTDNIIDNIEGITFGPTLPNGNKTILFIADDNFQIYGRQLNQILLFEIK